MLTQESLDSKEALEEFLYDNVSKGKLICVDIAVYDLDSWRNEAYERVYKEVIKISSCGWFKYYIIGKIYTIFKNYLLKRENKALQKKRATNQIKREHSVILTPLVASVDSAQTPDPKCRYTWHSEALTSGCCSPHTTRPPSASTGHDR